MATFTAARAFLLAILLHIGIAARVQIDVSDPDPEQVPVAFQCPSECWQCCVTNHGGGWWGNSDEKFKCILRNITNLPRGRECDKPEVRANDPDSIKTHCAFNSGEDSERPSEKCETQGAFSKWADWLWQKKGEVFGLANGKVMEMASIIKRIHSVGRKEDIVLPLSQLSSIHPIDEPGALLKTAGRARSAQAARDVLGKAPYTMSKALIASCPGLKDFQSVTGFYVVKLGTDEYVTFEGNGRCVALLWAFSEGDELRERLKIEVTEFVIDDAKEREKIVERIWALQKRMGSREFRAIHPSSLETDKVAEWAKGVKAELEILRANAMNVTGSKP